MSDITNYTDEQEIVDQKAIELAEDFSYDGSGCWTYGYYSN